MDVIYYSPHRPRGFTIIEILIALALLGFLMIVVSPLLGDMLRFKQRMATEENLKVLVAAMETAVSADPLRHGFEAKDGAFATGRYVASGNVQYVIRDGQMTFDGWSVNFNDPTAPTQFRSILDLSGLSNAALLDGYGRPFLVRVSNVLSTSFDGVPLEYQVVALISNNGGEISPAGTPVLNPGTAFDPATGRLVLAGQDIGDTFSTLPVYIRNLKKAKDQLGTIERAWYAYYKSRQLSDPDRTFARDYFAWKQGSVEWDNQGNAPTGRVPLTLGHGRLLRLCACSPCPAGWLMWHTLKRPLPLHRD